MSYKRIPKPPVQRVCFSPAEVAEAVHLTEDDILELIALHRIPAAKMGTARKPSWRIFKEEFEELCAHPPLAPERRTLPQPDILAKPRPQAATSKRQIERELQIDFAKRLRHFGWKTELEVRMSMDSVTRCDIVAKRGSTIRLIEVKTRHPLSGVGQVLGYKHLYERPALPTLLVPIQFQNDTLRVVCSVTGIDLWNEYTDLYYDRKQYAHEAGTLLEAAACSPTTR